ncbi:hypothetical protein Dimus_008948 [Dionaea muscipula]
MDCDDDDSQCHNLHLAGEGRTKSLLRPYAFPKFDFDDSLQGHLKFDSLVESEVFLGIQSQEGNHWIEEFSRANNVIEFSSSATETCSVSRRNDVWSEATSTESVEMLLNSVGQEEMAPLETLVEESSNCDELRCLTDQMEHNHKLNDGKDEFVTDSVASVAQAGFAETFSGLDVGMEPPTEVTSQFQNAEGNSGQLGPASDACTSMTGVHLFASGVYDGNSEREAKFFPNDAKVPVGKPIGEGSYDSFSLVDNFNHNAGILSTSDTGKQASTLSLESAGGLLEDISYEKSQRTSSMEAKTEVQIFEPNIDDSAGHLVQNSPQLVSNADIESKGVSLENNSDSSEESNGTMAKDESQLQGLKTSVISVSHINSEQSGIVSVELFSVNGNINHPYRGRYQGCGRDDDLEQLGSQFSSGETAHTGSSALKIESSIQSDQRNDGNHLEDMPENSLEINSKVSANTPEPSLFSGEESEFSIGKTSSDINTAGCGSSDLAVLSSPPMLISGGKAHEILEACHDSSAAEKDLSNVYVHCSSFVEGGTEQSDADAIEHDYAVIDNKNCFGKSPCDVRSVGTEDVETATIDPTFGSLSACVNAIGAGMAAQDLHPEVDVKLESENKVCPLGKSLDKDSMNYFTAENGQPSGVTPSHIDEGQEFARQISTDATFPSLKVLASGTSEVDAASEADVGATVEAAGAMLSDIVEKAIPTEAYDDASMGEPVAVVGCDTSKCFSEESNAHPSDEAVHKEVGTGGMLAERHVCDDASAQPLDQKAACDSPTIISSKELSQNERVNLEEARKVQSVAEDPGRKDTVMDDSSFTFEVNSLPHIPERINGNNWSPFPCSEMCNPSMVVGGTLPASAATTTPGRSRKGSGIGCRTPRNASERKSRRGSAKATSKENKINQVETIPKKSKVKEDEFCDSPMRPGGGSPNAKFADMQPFGRTELNNTAFSGAIAIPTSNLPDLNSSTLNNLAIQAATFHQPFTDMQQFQLRAQILVYGSLIQGTAPDEPCMVAAFGPSDGGRSVWEPVWRAAVERVLKKKSQSSSPETPQSHCKTHDITAKQVSQQNRLPPSPVSRAHSKMAPGTIVNPSMPLSSPVWTLSTPSPDTVHASGLQRAFIMDLQPAVSTLHCYQTPPTRNLAAPTPWPSQGLYSAACFSSTRSLSDSSTLLAPMSRTETVKLTPARDPSGPSAAGVLLATSTPLVHAGVPTTLFDGASPLPEIIKATVFGEQYSPDAKPKQRNKVPDSGVLGQISVLPKTQTEVVVPSSVIPTSSTVVVSETRTERAVASSLMRPTSSLITDITPAVLPRIDMCKSSVDVTPTSSAEQFKEVDSDTGNTVTSSEEILSKVAEARLQAEKAASLAADAVSHSQGVWTQLARQREAGLNSEVEAKLASAAVAIAAAASVATAAAAAAEIASNAALQAKLMAGEALISLNTTNPAQGGGVPFVEAHNMGKATPASILKADVGCTESTSILVAAKEAAKRRLEAASAASKQAENLDAIVKAAELAAEAVSQAGKIVAMGDPLLLNELMRTGPDHHRKLPPAFPEIAVDINKRGETIARNDEDTVSGNDMAYEQGVNSVTHGNATPARQSSNDTLNYSFRLVDGCEPAIPVQEQDLEKLKAAEAPRSNETLPQVESEPINCAFQNEDDDKMDMLHENTIKPGCRVEVLKDGDDSKSGWFTARALTLDDGKALVSFEDLLAEDGSGYLKEWVSLEGDGDNAPRIRLPYPPSSMQFQGAKKRRRAGRDDYAWAVGDKVDALINHCWCEGFLSAKNEKDETTFMIHFPAHRETTVVRAWQLRPSRTWSDGKWIQCPSVENHKCSNLGDTPKEKRRKLAVTSIESGSDKLSGDINHHVAKPEESNSLALTASEKVFNVGRSSTEETKPAHRTLRTGLQKEGSTIYGLPKPGKKQKFMEVSKHFPADRNHKTREASDSTKFSKYLMPQVTISRGWKNASKSDSKEKQAPESKARAPCTQRPHNISSRITPLRDHNLANPALVVLDKTVRDHGSHIEASVDENVVEKSTRREDCFSSILPSGVVEAAKGPLSSLFVDGSSKRVSSSTSESKRLSKRKFVPSNGRLTKIDEEKVYDGNSSKSAMNVVEPRRSNRRIQPTHRLLEGLQSSMIISKMPTIFHDKGPRSQSKSSSISSKPVK